MASRFAGGNAVTFNGGGINNQGILTLSASRVYTNIADSGGGIYNEGVLNISGSILEDNLATASVLGSTGGGALANVGQVTVFTSTFRNNVVPASDGGALFNNNASLGPATFVATTSVFTNNHAQDGGAIENSQGTIEVISSTFTSNLADFDGGAIDTTGSAYNYRQYF